MNVKPGDLAIVIRSKYAGRICEVLSPCPQNDFLLPDGFMGAGNPLFPQMWVLKFQNPVQAPVELGDLTIGERTTFYGVGSDAKLRPISGLPLQEDEKTDIKAPA